MYAQVVKTFNELQTVRLIVLLQGKLSFKLSNTEFTDFEATFLLKFVDFNFETSHKFDFAIEGCFQLKC